jgi:hypothetical protein
MASLSDYGLVQKVNPATGRTEWFMPASAFYNLAGGAGGFDPSATLANQPWDMYGTSPGETATGLLEQRNLSPGGMGTFDPSQNGVWFGGGDQASFGQTGSYFATPASGDTGNFLTDVAAPWASSAREFLPYAAAFVGGINGAVGQGWLPAGDSGLGGYMYTADGGAGGAGSVTTDTVNSNAWGNAATAAGRDFSPAYGAGDYLGSAATPAGYGAAAAAAGAAAAGSGAAGAGAGGAASAGMFGNLGTAALLAGSSLLSAGVGSKAASDAASAQRDAAATAAQASLQAAREGIAAQQANLATVRNDLAPYRDAGTAVLPSLQKMASDISSTTPFSYSPFSFTAADYQKDPGYDFVQGQGEQAIQRAATAKGANYSGATLKELSRFNTGLASTDFNNAFNRASTTYGTNFNTALNTFSTNLGAKVTGYNTLADIARLGSNAASMTANAGTNVANQTTAALTGAGNTAANAALVAGQATANGYTGTASAINNSIQGGLSNYLYLQRYNQQASQMPVFGLNQTASPSAVSMGR